MRISYNFYSSKLISNIPTSYDKFVESFYLKYKLYLETISILKQQQFRKPAAELIVSTNFTEYIMLFNKIMKCVDNKNLCLSNIFYYKYL